MVKEIVLARQFEADAMAISIDVDEIVGDLERQGMKTADIVEYLEQQFVSGQGPIADLKASFKGSTRGIVSRVVSIDHAREASKGNAESVGTWTTTGGGNTCQGCSARHGQHMTEREFESLHGTHECGPRCYCFWLPGKQDLEEAAINMTKLQKEHPEYFKL